MDGRSQRYRLYLWAGIAFTARRPDGVMRIGWGCALTDEDARGLALGQLVSALPPSGGWERHRVVTLNPTELPVSLVASLDAPELATWTGPVLRMERPDDWPGHDSQLPSDAPRSAPDISISVSLTDDWFQRLPKPGSEE